MKKLMLVIAILFMGLYSCKKEDVPQPSNQHNNVVQQDSIKYRFVVKNESYPGDCYPNIAFSTQDSLFKDYLFYNIPFPSQNYTPIIFCANYSYPQNPFIDFYFSNVFCDAVTYTKYTDRNPIYLMGQCQIMDVTNHIIPANITIQLFKNDTLIFDTTGHDMSFNYGLKISN